MDKYILYRKAYRELKTATPLRSDCGLLCGSLCCKGGDTRGMILFPDETIMQSGKDHIKTITQRNKVWFMVCKGICKRDERPLACRMFPLIPYLDHSSILHIIEDPRAKYICPLIYGKQEIKMSASFRKKLNAVFKFLLRDEDIKDHITMLCRTAEEYADFIGQPLP